MPRTDHANNTDITSFTEKLGELEVPKQKSLVIAAASAAVCLIHTRDIPPKKPCEF